MLTSFPDDEILRYVRKRVGTSAPPSVPSPPPRTRRRKQEKKVDDDQ